MRDFTFRQAVALVTVLVIGLGAIAVAAFGSQSLALALMGLLIVLTFFAVVQVRRRVAMMQQRLAREAQAGRRDIEQIRKNNRHLNHEVAVMQQRLALRQRQILAALENERLAAADRQRGLLSKIRDLQRRVDQLSPGSYPVGDLREGQTGAGER
jgi:hypothetical protein